MIFMKLSLSLNSNRTFCYKWKSLLPVKIGVEHDSIKQAIVNTIGKNNYTVGKEIKTP